MDATSIFNIRSPEEFNAAAMEVFRYQAEHNEVYREYLTHLKVDMAGVTPEAIPHLPISLFKTRDVKAFTEEPAVIFKSSGTSGQTSSHALKDLGVYNRSLTTSFEQFYGPVQEWTFLALLPGYAEHSSLIYMVRKLMELSGSDKSGFYLDQREALVEILRSATGQTMLIGVSFALLELAEEFKLDLVDTVVVETGGMKGQREEITRSQLHERLTSRFGVPVIHSEYGMTEMLSQAWSQGEGLFQCPPWMRVSTRDVYDPLLTSTSGGGVLNITDLANVHSCSFVATDDLGVIRDNGFEVLGRLDQSDLRGCNLLVTSAL